MAHSILSVKAVAFQASITQHSGDLTVFLSGYFQSKFSLFRGFVFSSPFVFSSLSLVLRHADVCVLSCQIKIEETVRRTRLFSHVPDEHRLILREIPYWLIWRVFAMAINSIGTELNQLRQEGFVVDSHYAIRAIN